MSGVLRVWKRFRNAHIMEEGVLMNVLLELEQCSHPLQAYIKQNNTAVKRLGTWAGEQSEHINSFLGEMGQLETEFNDSISDFIGGYYKYIAIWKLILVERKELKGLLHAHEKAEKAVTKAKKNLIKAEKNDPEGRRPSHDAPPTGDAQQSSPKKRSSKTGSVESCTLSLEAAIKEEKKLSEELSTKTLEVQKDVHEKLRSAYLQLCEIRMKHYRRCAYITEKALAFVRNFPCVDSMAENGDFTVKPFPTPLEIKDPNWFRGKELQMSLDIERQAARLAVESEQKSKQAALNKQEQEHDAKQLEIVQKLSDLQKKHADLMLSLKTAADQTEATLQQRNQALTAENCGLKEQLAEMKKAIVQLSLKEAKRSLEAAEKGLEADVIAYFVSQIDAALSEKKKLDESTDMSQSDFVLLTSQMSHAITATILSCVGAAQTIKKPEQMGHLFTHARNVVSTSQGFLDAGNKQLDGDSLATVHVPEDEVKALGDALEKLRAEAAKLEIGDELPAEVAETVDSARQLLMDALETIKLLRKDNEKEPNARRKEVHIKLFDHGEVMMSQSLATIDEALSMKHLFTKQSKDLPGAEAKILDRNWTDVLQGSVEKIVEDAPLWVECMRQVVKDDDRYNEFQVSTRSIAAFSAQMVATCRSIQLSNVRDSREKIESSSGTVINGSHRLLDAIREAHSLSLASIVLDDFDDLTENQAKKLMMDTQVQVLKMEQGLNDAREKLGRLRRLNYNNEKERRSSISSKPVKPVKPAKTASTQEPIPDASEPDLEPKTEQPAVILSNSGSPTGKGLMRRNSSLTVV